MTKLRNAHLSMCMNNGTTAAVPSGEEDTTMTTFVLDVLQTVDQVRNTTETETDASNGSPATGLNLLACGCFR